MGEAQGVTDGWWGMATEAELEHWTRLANAPGTPTDVLYSIAYHVPSLRATVLMHANCSAQLAEWIRSVESPIDAAPQSAPEPTAHGLVAAPGPVAAQAVPASPDARAADHPPRRSVGAFAVAACALLALIGGVSLGVAGVSIASSSAASAPSKNGNAPDQPNADESQGATANDDSGSVGGEGAQPVADDDSAAQHPTVLVLDASGSMVRENADGISRMQQARKAAAAAVTALPANAQVGLLAFGTGTGNTEREAKAGCRDVKTLVELGPLDRPTMLAAIDGLRASGYTPLGRSLQAATRELNGTGTIVLVSDGVDVCEPPACEVAAELRAQHPQLTINAVGFAVDGDEAAQAQLGCIGRVGGGGFVSASNTEQLAARMRLATNPDAAAAALRSTGYGPVELGMSVDEVTALEPTALEVDRYKKNDVLYIVVECAWATFEFRDGELASITPIAKVGTAEGLRLGDDVSMARTLYGKKVDAGQDDLGNYEVYESAPGTTNGYRVYAQAGSVRLIVVCGCVPIRTDTRGIGSWTADENGVGPIRVGMTLDELTADVPWVRATRFDEYGYAMLYDRDNLQIIAEESHSKPGTIGRVTVQTAVNGPVPEGPTIGALGLGASEALVRATFPGGSGETNVSSGTLLHYRVSTTSDRLLSFLLDFDYSGQPEYGQRTLRSFRVGQSGNEWDRWDWR